MRDRSEAPNGIGDLADPSLIATLAGWLERSGVRELEIVTADGQALKIVLKAGRASTAGAAPGGEAGVRAPLAGHFRVAHPAAGEDRPPLRRGKKVQRGEIVGFVAVGPALLPVVADEAGTVRDIHVSDGDPVGYGAVILSLEQVP